jgi:hypothetical protein
MQLLALDTNVACMGSMHNVGFKHVGITSSSIRGNAGFRVSCEYYKNVSHIQCEF